MTILIQAANVSYAHGGNRVLDGASLEVKSGDRLALIGANGSGKSTLFRLLARDLPPQAGAVTVARGTTVGMLAQESGLDPASTVHDAVALAAGDPAALEAQVADRERRMGEAADDDELTAVLDAYAAALERLERGGDPAGGDEAEVVLAGLGIPRGRWGEPVGHLSGGEKKLVGLARLLLEAPDVLLLDEPDNHLDFAGKAWLEGRVRDHGRRGAVAVISHDRRFIDEVATRILELERGAIEGYPGGYAAFQEAKRAKRERAAERRELEEREFKKLKASAEQLTQWARQNPKFAPRAENMRRKLAEERERLERTPAPVLRQRGIAVEFGAERGGTQVLVASGLAKTYGERRVFAPFDLIVRHGEGVGLVGPNGAGKTTLFKTILGQEEPTAGTLRLGPSVVVGYYAQEQETLDPDATPMETVRRLKPMTEQAAIGFLGAYLFDRGDILNKIGNLSGGERSRLQIACLILKGANFLLLDEPTNNLDIASIDALEEALLAFLETGKGSLLTISHDRAFLDAVCDRIVALDGGEVRDYPGGFSFYEANRDKGTLRTVRPAVPVAPPPPRRVGKAKTGTSAPR